MKICQNTEHPNTKWRVVFIRHRQGIQDGRHPVHLQEVKWNPLTEQYYIKIFTRLIAISNASWIELDFLQYHPNCKKFIVFYL